MGDKGYRNAGTVVVTWLTVRVVHVERRTLFHFAHSVVIISESHPTGKNYSAIHCAFLARVHTHGRMGKITSDISTALADVIRRRREAKGMSLAKLAELSGVAQTYPGMIEKGLRSPTVDVAHAMARAVGCNLSDLIREAELLIKRRK